MKYYEYLVQGKPASSENGWSCLGEYDNLDEAKGRIRDEKDLDQSQNNRWDYRIQRREVSDWEVIDEEN